MVWTSKKVFKATDSVSSKISPSVWVYDPTQAPTPPPTEPTQVIEDIQGQIDDIVDSIESNYAIDFVFDKYDYFISTKPFYFYFEIPLGTTEIVSASVSFEVKDYRNSSLTHSRYAITGDSEDRPIITFYVSEDKGHLFRDAYGPYETDMRAIDILGDLTDEGIKVIKFETDNDVCVTARVFLRLKIAVGGGGSGGGIIGGDTVNGERPEVRTLAATSIADVSATLNGDIISVGKGNYVDRTTGEIKPITVTKRGFQYGLTRTNTWDTNESDSYVRGVFGISVTGLAAETDYYFRAYAENQVGRSYGEYMKLTTSAPIPAIYIVCEDAGTQIFYIKSYNVNGTLVDTWNLGLVAIENIGNAMCVDVNGNVYYLWDDQHTIRKRNSSGILILSKTETNYIYNIVAGPDGYIYTFEYDSSFNNGYISKRNASDLVSVGTKIVDSGGNRQYYGMAIDSDGDFYVLNNTQTRYERWDFTTGLVSSVAANHDTFNSLGVVLTTLADVDWMHHAIKRAKILSGDETDVELEDMSEPCAVGSIGNCFLFTGDNVDSDLVLGKYDVALGKIWVTIVPGGYLYGPIAAYPF